MSTEERSELFEHFDFTASIGQAPLRVDKFLMNFIDNATRNKIQKAAANGNILVNAMTVGLADTDKIFYSAAAGNGNAVVYVGSKTGRDGIHGATMASAEFSDDSEENGQDNPGNNTNRTKKAKII